MTKQKRVTVIVDDATFSKIQNIKKENFSDKPHTELYRELFRLGLERMAERAAGAK